MTTTTRTMSDTIWVEDGEQVYPCHCGETHRGPYAIYDYGHHNCRHAEPLMWICDDEAAMCVQCGQTFSVEPPEVQ